MALDFTTGVLDPRVTVTRALNTATRVNSSGYIETVNANLPRFDYNPTTLAPKGLLIEEARTNIVLQSSDSSQSPWTPASGGVGTLAVVTPNAGVSPDGTSNAVRVQFDCTNASSSSNRSRIQQIVTLINGTTYAKGVWIKAYDASNVGKTVRVLLEGASGTSVYTLTDQWVRVTPAAGAATGVVGNFMIETRGTFTTQTADILMWNATVEAGAFLTSDIITGATSLTRNADVVSMTGTNFSDWFNQTEGAFVTEADTVNPFSRWFYTVNDGSSTNYIGSDFNSSANVRFRVVNTGASQASVTSVAAVSANTIIKHAAAYATNSFNQALNGVLNTTDTTGSFVTMTQLQFSAANANPNLCGHIRNFRYYPQRLTNAELQAFST
jgi:hypothetical protein